MTFLTILGVTEILCNFILVLEGRTGKEIPESSRLQLEKFLANNFALPDGEENPSRLFSRGEYSRFTLVENTIAIRQKSREPSFWEVTDSFVLLVHANLRASKTLLQQLRACLNFTLDSEDSFC